MVFGIAGTIGNSATHNEFPRPKKNHSRGICDMSKSRRYALNKNKYLLEPEAEKLEFLLKSHLKNDRRNCTLLFTALYTGARAQELLNLKYVDLNGYDQTVFIQGIKNSNDRELPVPSWLFESLTNLSQAPKLNSSASNQSKIAVSSTYLFPISYNRLRQIWQLYRPVHKKFHALRHTFAIRLYRKTKDIRLLQVALGHRNITNTMIYADYVYSQHELKRLIL